MMRRRRKRRNRTIWTRDILLRRSEQGAYNNFDQRGGRYGKVSAMRVQGDDTASSAHHVVENPSNLIGPQSQSPRKLSRHTGTCSPKIEQAPYRDTCLPAAETGVPAPETGNIWPYTRGHVPRYMSPDTCSCNTSPRVCPA